MTVQFVLHLPPVCLVSTWYAQRFAARMPPNSPLGLRDAYLMCIFARERVDLQLDFGPTTGALCEKFSAPVPVYQVRREHGRGPRPPGFRHGGTPHVVIRFSLF